jgi:sec-independent protein translocase protein TatA
LVAFIVILLVILLLLGGDRIASAGRGLGGAVRGFKKGVREGDPKPKPKRVAVEQKAPKLLPAKGESSAPKTDPEDEKDT